METSRMRLGRRGEDIACKYLLDHGHTVVDRNWRSGHLEIDIVTVDPAGLHFVEVKSRVAPVQAAPGDTHSIISLPFTSATALVSAPITNFTARTASSLAGIT